MFSWLTILFHSQLDSNSYPLVINSAIRNPKSAIIYICSLLVPLNIAKRSHHRWDSTGIFCSLYFSDFRLLHSDFRNLSFYHAVKPPSTTSSIPVTYEDAEDAKNSMGPRRSESSAILPRGTRSQNLRLNSES